MNASNTSKRELLEDRLIDFAISTNEIIESFPNTYLGKNISNQISRSSISPALNYGEAQEAESTKDFIHKMGICLKELRETFAGLKIFDRSQKLSNDKNEINRLKTEVNELISIFVASIKTAKKRL
ncbi:four helix bundle protein [Lentimicrobium sp. S6]|uniref:four helix bundle protein n=1 Tax=Lentimicrobium sp. S6 TaxID=2735872 RepID=UPI001553D74E|nr:four helix bundle protein [Lentimicrobium sp. S6]NPD45498.1 four helix bundle protein [Lentimicrobium sp. S6]